MGVLLGLSQPQVCLWTGRLTPLGNAALGRELVLPARRPADLEKLLADVPEPPDTFRNLRQGFAEEAMQVASGLHNLRVTTRKATA